jgi:hypothetical protein
LPDAGDIVDIISSDVANATDAFDSLSNVEDTFDAGAPIDSVAIDDPTSEGDSVLVVDQVSPPDVADDAGLCDSSVPGYHCFADWRSDVIVGCPTTRTCSAAACPTGYVSCLQDAFQINGYLCIPDPSADVSAACPSARVCSTTDCPTGCIGCSQPMGCVPNVTDAGVVCTPSIACASTGCPPGCHALV